MRNRRKPYKTRSVDRNEIAMGFICVALTLGMAGGFILAAIGY